MGDPHPIPGRHRHVRGAQGFLQPARSLIRRWHVGQTRPGCDRAAAMGCGAHQSDSGGHCLGAGHEQQTPQLTPGDIPMLGLARYSRRLAIAAGLATTIGAFAWITGAVAQGNKPLAPVTLRLDWKPGAQHAPFYFAKAKGYYAAEGL